MMTDIVERLREYADGAPTKRYPDSLMREAADEIVRLRTKLVEVANRDAYWRDPHHGLGRAGMADDDEFAGSYMNEKGQIIAE